MLKEAIQLIQDTAIKAKSVQHLFDSVDGRTKHYSVEGKVVQVDGGIQPRDHVVLSLEDLFSYIQTNTLEHPSIWHNVHGVTMVCDHDDRRDLVRIVFGMSSEFRKLTEMETGNNRFAQFDFVRLLHRTFQVDAPMVAKFRKLDFKVVQAAEGEIQHGKDRMGKSIASEVMGTSDIPEDITVAVPIYDTIGERNVYSFSCSVDIDAAKNQIVFAPLPGELSVAMEEHQASVHRRLTEVIGDKVERIYAGTP